MPEQVGDHFLATLQRVYDGALTLTPDQLAVMVDVPAYNRPLRVAEVLDLQIGHPGLVHGAQLTSCLGQAPLWTHYPPDMFQRQITRFFGAMSHAYWPERGGARRARIQFTANGFGVWYVDIAPSGGDYGMVKAGDNRKPIMKVYASSADTLARLMTFHIEPVRAVLSGEIRVSGDLLLLLRLTHLFAATT